MTANRKLVVVRITTFALLAIAFTYLFYIEALNIAESDVHAHIKLALKPQADYSLMYPLIGFMFTRFGEMGVAVLLTAFEVAVLAVSEQFMRQLMPRTRPAVVFVLALACNFAIAVNLPIIWPHFTWGLSCGNAWHNSTFIAMKLLALVSIWTYLRLVGYLGSRNRALDWAFFAASIILGAAFKPSFVMMFGPILCVFCLVDLVAIDRRTFKRSLGIAAVFVAALLILLYQYKVLYVDKGTSSIAFGFARLWRKANPCMPLGMLQSYILPLAIFILCIRTQLKDRNYQVALTVFIVSLLIYLFVYESGKRFWHGNFGWGLKFGIYYLMISSVVAYCNTRGLSIPLLSGKAGKDLVAYAQEPASIREIAPVLAPVARTRPIQVPDILVFVLFAWHTVSGIAYFINMMMGNGYF